MTRRYLWLFVAVLAAALLVQLMSRAGSRPRRTQEPAAAVERAVSLELRAGSVIADPPAVAIGDRVALTLVNHSGRVSRVSLSGYEDRLAIPPIAPDSTWRGSFTADRPGEQLAWLVDGVPRGRFDVTGSHLIEGHR